MDFFTLPSSKMMMHKIAEPRKNVEPRQGRGRQVLERKLSIERDHPEAFDRAARAIHEAYSGKDSWGSADKNQRSHARQALRVAMGALSRNGAEVEKPTAPARPPVDIEPAALAQAPKASPRTKPARPPFVLPTPRR